MFAAAAIAAGVHGAADALHMTGIRLILSHR